MRPTSFLVALLSGPILFAQAAPSKEELKVREMLAKDKPYKAISTCDHMIGSQHRNEFLALRAQGLNMIAAYDRAETDARRALAAFPGDVPSLHQLAIAELGLGKTDSAAIHFQRVLRTDRSRDVRYRMALTYQKQHNYRDALMQLDQALVEGAKDGPDAAKYHRVKGECLSMRNDSVLARIEYDKALALSPRDQVTLNSRGFYFFAHFGYHALAIADYTSAIKLDPNYSYAFNNRGWSLYKLGEKDRGLKDIRLAGRKKKDNPYVYRNLGIIALESGDTTEGCAYLNQAIEYRFTPLFGDEVEEIVKTSCGHENHLAVPLEAPKMSIDKPKPTTTHENAP